MEYNNLSYIYLHSKGKTKISETNLSTKYEAIFPATPYAGAKFPSFDSKSVAVACNNHYNSYTIHQTGMYEY
jgi:hypothetical protein